jgi:hypothetical protein
MNSQSTADRFIAVMAQLRAIDPDNDEPMRHAMRALRNEAEAVIDSAIRHASQLAYWAEQVARDHRKEVEAAATPTKGSQP